MRVEGALKHEGRVVVLSLDVIWWGQLGKVAGFPPWLSGMLLLAVNFRRSASSRALLGEGEVGSWCGFGSHHVRYSGT